MPIFSTACPRNCYSSCSFKVEIIDHRIHRILPHPENRATPEGVCLKGLAYAERAHSPERITEPLFRDKKTGEISKIEWDKALVLIAKKLTTLKTEYGSHSILYYAASGMSGLLNGFSYGFWKLFGGTTITYGNNCWPAGLEATRLTLGDNKHNAPWDLENAKLIILWGKNPAETNIQQTIPINKALDNGARLYVVDPRRTASSERARMLIQPKPGTDGAIALAISNYLINRGLIDQDFIDEYVLGYEEFKEHVAQFTTKWAADIADVPERFIIDLAHDIGTIKPMSIVPGYGMQRFTNGGQTVRAILALQVLTGNIGKKGATWHYANLQSYIFDSQKEPYSYYPKVDPDSDFRRTIGMATLGEDILKASDPPMKMIWVERGNPITQNAETPKVKKAFEAMDFVVVVDQFMTDTAQMADLVLPAKNMFEQSDIIGGYWSPYVQLKPKVLNPPENVKPETEIYYLLAKELGLNLDSDLILKPGQEENYLKKKAKEHDLDWEELLKKPLIPHNHEEIAYSDLRFDTPSGKIELLSPEIKELWNTDIFPNYMSLAETPDNSGFDFYLLSPNSKNKIHSQFNNLGLIKQLMPYPTVKIHPEPAIKRGIKPNDKVRVWNNRGEFNLVAEYDYGIRENCLSIPNGWWNQQGGSVNFLSKARFTDMGYGTAYHDNCVNIEKA